MLYSALALRDDVDERGNQMLMSIVGVVVGERSAKEFRGRVFPISKAKQGEGSGEDWGTREKMESKTESVPSSLLQNLIQLFLLTTG